MFTRIAIIAAFSALAAAAPTARDTNGPFSVVAARSGSPIHLSAINASGTGFFIGKDTSTYCPPAAGLDCSKTGDSTVFSASTAAQTLGLAASVPGGQQVYVRPDGSLAYTQAHSASMPEDSITSPFVYTPATESGSIGSLTFKGDGFYACPVGTQDGVYQIYSTQVNATGRSDTCIGFSAATAEYSGANVWQYA